jgi:hypothetical protein
MQQLRHPVRCLLSNSPHAAVCSVAGAEGQIALRLVKELAAAGEKVVAGVADIERGQAALAFAKRYELLAPDALANIRLAEVDYSDPDSFSLTAKGRLVVVDGDEYVGGRTPDVSLGFRGLRVLGRCRSNHAEAMPKHKCASTALLPAAAARGPSNSTTQQQHNTCLNELVNPSQTCALDSCCWCLRLDLLSHKNLSFLDFLLQVLGASLAAAADAGATAFVITSGPSACAGTKSSGGGGLFAFGGGAKGPAGADRASQLAEKAGVGSYFVIRGAGLTSGSPATAAPGLVVAEAGSVDPALAGQVRVREGRCACNFVLAFLSCFVSCFMLLRVHTLKSRQVRPVAGLTLASSCWLYCC